MPSDPPRRDKKIFEPLCAPKNFFTTGSEPSQILAWISACSEIRNNDEIHLVNHKYPRILCTKMFPNFESDVN